MTARVKQQVAEAMQPATTAAAMARRRKQQAVLWGCVTSSTFVIFYVLAPLFVLPGVPAGMGYKPLPQGEAGMGLVPFGRVLLLSGLMTAAILVFEEAVMRPFFKRAAGSNEKIVTEAVIFTFSIFARLTFGATLVYHHYIGASRHNAAAVGDGAYREPTLALFYALYFSELLQMCVLYEDFGRSYTGQMIGHHYITLAWFSVWMLFLAPKSADGAAIWNAVSARALVVCCCLSASLLLNRFRRSPNHPTYHIHAGPHLPHRLHSLPRVQGGNALPPPHLDGPAPHPHHVAAVEHQHGRPSLLFHPVPHLPAGLLLPCCPYPAVW
jgi:hypothetical protein